MGLSEKADLHRALSTEVCDMWLWYDDIVLTMMKMIKKDDEKKNRRDGRSDMRPNESDSARGLSEAADPHRALSTEACDMWFWYDDTMFIMMKIIIKKMKKKTGQMVGLICGQMRVIAQGGWVRRLTRPEQSSYRTFYWRLALGRGCWSCFGCWLMEMWNNSRLDFKKPSHSFYRKGSPQFMLLPRLKS